jgi:hypothetical protein
MARVRGQAAAVAVACGAIQDPGIGGGPNSVRLADVRGQEVLLGHAAEGRRRSGGNFVHFHFYRKVTKTFYTQEYRTSFHLNGMISQSVDSDSLTITVRQKSC